MATTPSSLSLKQLTGTVDNAVKAALQRHNAKSSAGFVLNPGILAGPLLDLATDIKVAQHIADDITKQVQAGGGQHAAISQPLASGVLITHTHILCGFFPYPAPVLNVAQ